MTVNKGIMDKQYESEPIGCILQLLITTSVQLNEVTNKLINFYYKNHRHRYSQISKFILEKNMQNKEVIEVMLINLEYLNSYIKENKTIIEEDINKLGKKELVLLQIIKKERVSMDICVKLR